MLPSKINFSMSDIWIQFHDLPISWKTMEDMDEILKAQFQGLIKIKDNSLSPSIWVKYMREKVVVDLGQPLPYRFWASDEADSEWVNYKYEKFPFKFCYSCGRIGHSSSACEFKKELLENRYGEHMRVCEISSP
ncbi:hypothetical protein LINPERHAP2_LOCUS33691 [Linum perenne]